MIYLSEYNVESFKGISNLKITDLGDVNIILGDNNCGKTSVLESIMLLKNTFDFTNVLRVSRLRNTGLFQNRLTAFEYFVYMFDQASDSMKISLNGTLNDNPVDFQIRGNFENVLVDNEVINATYPRRKNLNDSQMSLWSSEDDNDESVEVIEEEITEFRGTIKSLYGEKKRILPIKINELTSVTGARINKNSNINIEYISPVEHTTGSIFDRIVKKKEYKDEVLELVHLFDDNIFDFLYLKNERSFRFVEYVSHRTLGNIPLSSFGDGVKKAIALANRIVTASGGILLIDEIDTSLHSKYFDEIFSFVIKACMKSKIQLFITTHSMEAIDRFLNTQNYDNNKNENDLIRIITLRKRNNQTYSRVMTGRDVYYDRMNFGFEVRI